MKWVAHYKCNELYELYNSKHTGSPGNILTWDRLGRKVYSNLNFRDLSKYKEIGRYKGYRILFYLFF